MSALSDLPDIQPDALYSVREVAYILGYRGKDKANTNRVHEIPYPELPRIKMGPRGGKVMFMGRDVLAYINSRRRVERAS